MRRLATLLALAALALIASTSAAGAEPRVLPPLHLQLTITADYTTDEVQRTAALEVSGTQCVPQDAPASVIVTLDRLPGDVFTAKPNANGRWFLTIPIELPVDGVYVVDAECDNYFGATAYPTATTDADHVVLYGVAASAGGSGGGEPPVVVIDDGGLVANTGPHTGTELGIAAAAVLVGLLFLVAGRPRRATRTGTDHGVGRHRDAD